MMDSGNSGSLNSSSGGDEEYDSRAGADSFSAFFSSGNPTGSATLAQPTPSYQPTTPFYDTLSFLDSNPSALANLDLPWSRTSLNPSPPPPNPNPNPNPSMFPSSSSTPYSSAINTTVNPPQQPAPPPAAPPRNSKKRSRASRRAPTTVLTTDTSNFRAMVQEFTGIPAPPFASSSSSPFHRSCFDLLHSPALRSAAAEQPPYILRPFAHKLHPSAGSNVNAGAARPGTQLPPPDLSIANQNQALLNIQQNPMLSLQSLLQSPLNPKYNYGPKSRAPVSYAAAGEMGLSNLIRTSETMQSNWAPAADDQPQFRPVGCFGDSQRGGGGGGSGCKMNFSSTGPGPAQDFRADKQGENLPAGARGEATVESWICSSD